MAGRPRALRTPSAGLAVLLLVAAGVRLGLVLQEWPASNSDEGTMGLMAMHVAEGRRFPGFMDGQSYMGTAEAYVAAAGFRVFGPSLLGLRLSMLLWFLLFLGTLHLLARRLYGPSVALVSVGLLALGSRELYGSELVAQGAMPETLLAGTVMLLLGHRLLELSDDPAGAAGRGWRPAAWGVTATLGLWSTALTAPFVLASGVLVLLALRRGTAPAGQWWALGGGLLVGAAPWILHDLTHPWRESGVVGVLEVYLNGGTGLDGGQSAGLVSQVTRTLTTSLAYATGGSALAHPSSPPAWPYGYPGSWRPPTDDIVTTAWGVALVALWVVALTACLRALRRRATPPPADCDAAARARVWGRTALLVAAGLTVVAFAVSPAPGVAPANNVRYLIGLLVATPAVIAPLWDLRDARPRTGGLLRAAVLLLVALSLGLGTAQAYRDAAAGPGERPDRELIDSLQRNGIRHLYSGYLDCNRLTFLSREEVVCAVLAADPDRGLRPGFDRYLPYRAAVQDDPGAAYAFRTGDPRNAVLEGSACRWRNRWQVSGYQIWQAAGPCVPAASP